MDGSGFEDRNNGLEVVSGGQVLVGPEADLGELRAYAAEHLWTSSGDGQWRSPLRVQFEQPLPVAAYRAIGELVEQYPDIEVYAYDQADPSLVWLQQMPALRHLSVDLPTIESFDPLDHARGLQGLSLGGTLGAARSLSVLAHLQGLEELGLEGHARHFGAVAELPRLRSLRLYDSKAQDLTALSAATSLELLSLSFGRVRDFGAIAGLPALRGISIWNTRGMTADHLTALGDLPALEALDLGAMRRVEALSFLQGRAPATLRHLLLEGFAGLRDWSHIAGLDALEGLGVWGGGSLDLDVGPLLAAARLEVLALEPKLPDDQAARLIAEFHGHGLLIDGRWMRESDAASRVGFRAGPVDMLRTSVHGRQYAGRAAGPAST